MLLRYGTTSLFEPARFGKATICEYTFYLLDSIIVGPKSHNTEFVFAPNYPKDRSRSKSFHFAPHPQSLYIGIHKTQHDCTIFPGLANYGIDLIQGRSPYEVPDNETVDPSAPVRRVSEVHADNYMQEYDARGHPVNTESRTMGKALRRAKNDILSTMGIVVSREDRNAGTPNEQQKLNQIASENDFGLVITTLDQLFIFFGTWWTSSLTGRVQVIGFE